MKNKELGLNDKMTFGEHKGSTIKYLIDNEPSYLEWAIEDVKDFVLNVEADDYLEDKLIEQSGWWDYPSPHYSDW